MLEAGSIPSQPLGLLTGFILVTRLCTTQYPKNLLRLYIFSTWLSSRMYCSSSAENWEVTELSSPSQPSDFSLFQLFRFKPN
ncbi:hypothetical protein EDB80DRAFT_733569 [Ilyonectria destructans]|nr:hypothetical protein EDB80DRAFT_733569 [Ilyonectria destructans]